MRSKHDSDAAFEAWVTSGGGQDRLRTGIVSQLNASADRYSEARIILMRAESVLKEKEANLARTVGDFYETVTGSPLPGHNAPQVVRRRKRLRTDQ